MEVSVLNLWLLMLQMRTLNSPILSSRQLVTTSTTPITPITIPATTTIESSIPVDPTPTIYTTPRYLPPSKYWPLNLIANTLGVAMTGQCFYGVYTFGVIVNTDSKKARNSNNIFTIMPEKLSYVSYNQGKGTHHLFTYMVPEEAITMLHHSHGTWAHTRWYWVLINKCNTFKPPTMTM